MLPQETSVRQLKKLRAETKGTDIGDLTKDDRLNHNVPNLQYIGNPIDTGIESWQEFCQKDNELQTIAFKSKLVNKPIVKENKIENMKDIKTFEDFNEDDFNDEEILQRYKDPNYENRDVEPEYFEEYPDKNPTDLDDIDEIDRKDMIDLIYDYSRFEREELENMSDEELEEIYDDLEIGVGEHDELEESIKTFEHFGEGRDEYARIKKMEEDEEQELSERPFEDEDEDEDNKRMVAGFEMKDDDEIDFFSDFEKRPEEIEEIDELETDDDLFNDEYSINDELESVKTFEAFSIPAAKKEEKQPEYTILGEEKEPKSNPNFGIGAVKAQEIKKISDFNLIDPPTPKERTIGGNAGVFIDNNTVKGFLNRIEGKDAYVESVDDPMVIKKFSLKDVVKTKKSE